jgi:hypothetical protein
MSRFYAASRVISTLAQSRAGIKPPFANFLQVSFRTLAQRRVLSAGCLVERESGGHAFEEVAFLFQVVRRWIRTLHIR